MMLESASLCVCVWTRAWVWLCTEGERGASSERGWESWLLSLVGSSSSVWWEEERKCTEVGAAGWLELLCVGLTRGDLCTGDGER